MERALAMELGRGARLPLVQALQSTAEAFLDASAQLAAGGRGPLELELTESLRGAVLLSAVARSGGAREAFEALGMEQRIQGGNHLRTLRRKADRLIALCEQLGVPLPPEWALD